MGVLGSLCLPLRAVFYLVLMAIMYPLMLLMSLLSALGKRCKGDASVLLSSGSSTPEVGPGKASASPGGYYGQVVLAKPFDDKSKVEATWKELLAECGQTGDQVTVEWLEDDGSNKKFRYGKIGPDEYHEPGSNWVKVALKAGEHTRLRILNRARGEATVMQFFTPGNSFDGSSNFNLMKEFFSRYYGNPKRDVFMTGRTTIKPQCAERIKEYSFCAYLCRLPWNVFLNTSSLVWCLVSFSGCCGGPGAFTPELALINFNKETSTRLAARLKERGISPFAAMSWAAVQGYNKWNGRYPSRIIQQCNLQRQLFDPPNPNRDWVGDWLFAPLQEVTAPYTLAQANEGYKKLMADIGDGVTGPSDSVVRAFQAKAYGPVSAGAAAFEVPPAYSEPTRLFSSSVFFNNYGVRSIVEEAEVIHWNWAAPFDLGCNCIQVNGCTTMAFGTMRYGLEGVQAIRDHAFGLLTDIIEGRDPEGQGGGYDYKLINNP